MDNRTENELVQVRGHQRVQVLVLALVLVLVLVPALELVLVLVLDPALVGRSNKHNQGGEQGPARTCSQNALAESGGGLFSQLDGPPAFSRVLEWLA